MSSSEHKQCIAIGCSLHQQCQLPVNYNARIRIWPPFMGKMCEHFIYRQRMEVEHE